MRSSQPPSPYLEAHFQRRPCWGQPRGQPLSRLRPSSRRENRGAPPGAPGRRRRSGGRPVPGIPGGGGASPRAGAWRGPSLPPRAILPWGQVRALPGAPLRGTASCPFAPGAAHWEPSPSPLRAGSGPGGRPARRGAAPPRGSLRAPRTSPCAPS